MKELNAAHWQERLDTIAKEAGVVGAVLGILRVKDGQPDEMVRCATGVLNITTGRNTTVDSLFQIGSDSKSWTATVIMQLVDEGKIALDQRVKDILPGFKLSTDDMTDNDVAGNNVYGVVPVGDGDLRDDDDGSGENDDWEYEYIYEEVEVDEEEEDNENEEDDDADSEYHNIDMNAHYEEDVDLESGGDWESEEDWDDESGEDSEDEEEYEDWDEEE